MKILFVRHSEPDYSMMDRAVNPCAYAGFGRDLAPLTERGRQLAERLAHDPRLAQAQVVISSSITRALETANYIVRQQDKPLLVEPFFHEWRPDLDGLNYTAETVYKAYQLFWENDGKLPVDSPIHYETAEQVQERFLLALEKYRHYDTAVIVCHGMLIRQFFYQEKIDYCELIEIEL